MRSAASRPRSAVPLLAVHLLAVIPCIAGALLGAVEEPSVPKPKPVPLALLQTITADGVRNALAVNGFDAEVLPSVRADAGAVPGFKTRLESYAVIHPYFLRPGPNTVSATYHLDLSQVADDDAGPWRLALRVARVAYAPSAEPRSDAFKDLELGVATSPDLPRGPAAEKPGTLTGTFTWNTTLPAWTWTHGVPIPEGTATRDDLYAEYGRLHATLLALREAAQSPARPGAPRPPALAAMLRASMAEFIQSSTTRGTAYTFSDDLCYAAAHLSMRWYDEEMAARAKRAADQPQTPVPPVVELTPQAPAHDRQSPDDTRPGPDGLMPTRLRLDPLPKVTDTRLTVFAGGTLAKLSDEHGGPLIAFRSNYADGNWGRRDTVKLSADIWFRRTADGTWAVDAMWPMEGASLSLSDQPLAELLEHTGF